MQDLVALRYARRILGVGPAATEEEIARAFRAQAKRYHPDLGGDEQRMRSVLQARAVLLAELRQEGRRAA